MSKAGQITAAEARWVLAVCFGEDGVQKIARDDWWQVGELEALIESCQT